jgi:hypothetical protein
MSSKHDIAVGGEFAELPAGMMGKSRAEVWNDGTIAAPGQAMPTVSVVP